jgi:uncharacterized protein (DUF433 family)
LEIDVKSDALGLGIYTFSEEGIVIDPARALGKPIVRASAMPTAVLAAAWGANGEDAERVADWYGVSPADVEAAVRFECQHIEAAA